MFCILFAIWLILNGKITLEICVFGVCICGALLWFMCRFMDYSLKKEFFMYLCIPWFLRYCWVLVKEIAKANIQVLRLILSPELQPEPELVYFDTKLKSGLAKVFLANSITLTPGTITVSVEDQHFCVHCLDKEMGEGLESCVFVELLEKFEKETDRWK